MSSGRLIRGRPQSTSRYFWPILTPPVTLCHTSRDLPKYVTHLGTPPIFSRPSTKTPNKSPLYKFSLNCSWGFCPGGFVRGSFVWKVLFGVVFVHIFPLLSEYICCNRKVNITLNFMFHMYKFCSKA